MESIAIIGAGPGGLVAARYLKSRGFKPVVFEQSRQIGGQWTGDPRISGVWPAMRTNTSRIMTAFSDLRHEPGTPVYPTNQAQCDYLRRYAEQLDLVQHVRLNTCIREVSRAPDGRGWKICFTDKKGMPREEIYHRVVVASGRHNKPAIPPIPGLESFSGACGTTHTFHYKDPERYQDRRVLVAGCSISALEIASDLAMLGAARVISSYRRQRYILQKMLAGVPTEHLAFTRLAALAEESMPIDVVAQGLKEFVTDSSGSPEQFGAPQPADNILEAGITQCQHFLPLVAEGRIVTKPWIREIDGRNVIFEDGTEEEVDGILFGTGYTLNLSFLSDELRRTLNIDGHHIDLDRFTFHPDLPGLAFLGQYEVVGPYYPVLESQARWIAYVWSGVRPEPSLEVMEENLAAYRALRGTPQPRPMHAMAVLFAREAGVEPELHKWPDLARALLFGPLSPISFRLSGPDSLPEAPQLILEDAEAFGAVPASDLSPDQKARLRVLAVARRDSTFTTLVEELTHRPAHDRYASATG